MAPKNEVLELSAIDIVYLVRELQDLNESKVEQIYQYEHTVMFVLYKQGFNKRVLTVAPPKSIFVGVEKGEIPITPPVFCSVIRKYVKNARIISISQRDLERVIDVVFEAKGKKYILVIELFGEGNCILCNADEKIIYPLLHQKWKDRVIKGGHLYKAPVREWNLKNIDESALNQHLQTTEKDTIVTFLALEAGLGGKYAEKICELAGIDKHTIPNKVCADTILSAFQTIIMHDVKLNASIVQYYTTHTTKKKEAAKTVLYDSHKSKAQKIVTMQEKTINESEKMADEYATKGDLIYKHYAFIEKMLIKMRDLRKKHTWEEIADEIEKKKHTYIRKIDQKNGKITLELS